MGRRSATGTVTFPSASRGTACSDTAQATAAFSSTVRARSIEPPMVDRLAIRDSRLSSTLAPAPTPMTTMRPPTDISGTTAATLAPPTSSRETS